MGNRDVSAIVPIKNGSEYIATSIPRILENLRPSDELIIVDDSSSDNTVELLLEYVIADARVKLLHNPGLGIVDALNHAIGHSKFEIIARFDIDDEYGLDRLEKQRDLLEGRVVAVFCDYTLIDSQSRYLGTIHSPILPIATRLSLEQSQRTPHPGVLFLKSPCLEVGSYRKGDDGAEDLSLWLRMSKVGDLISVPEVLFSYRIHKGSVTYSKRRAVKDLQVNLLREFPLAANDMKVIRSHITSTFNFYSSSPDQYARTILFVRELLLASSRKDMVLSALPLIWNLMSLNPILVIKTSVKLRSESRRRRVIRAF
jgi:glycosyltransferase involved in cell wall biosynthesis